MLLRKHIVSTRTLLQLAVAAIYTVAGVGAAVAANSGNPPLLVPYTVQTIAGTPQYPAGLTSVASGYGGDAGPAVPYLGPNGVVAGATMNSPYGVAVDSVGNVYITDTSNDVIREVNAQTGVINTIAGITPKGCAGVNCTTHFVGCADGVVANGNAIGGALKGIAVDAYGNVYFVDSTTGTVSVIYRGGTQVAAFITLEDPGGVSTSGGVQVGYLYHVAGTVNLSSCSGTTGNVDNAMAFQNAQLHSPTMLTLDSAGNIYIADIGNSTVRVINTQATAQTFFQYTVPPGFMRSITNCNAALTVQCTSPTTTTSGSGINGPVNALVFNSQYKAAMADAYGNVYQMNGTGSTTGPPGIYGSAAYAGGAPLTNLLTVEAPSIDPYWGPAPAPASNGSPAELNAQNQLTYGNAYDFLGDPALPATLPSDYPNVYATTATDFIIRPSSGVMDLNGTFWYLDTHFPELSRVDQYTSDALYIIGDRRATASISGLESSPASFTNPWYCVYGSSSLPWKQGPQEFDPQGDGCPAIIAQMGGTTTSGPFITADGLGQIYFTDSAPLVKELPMGNIFPATPLAGSASPAPVTQAIQIHFDRSNLPIPSPGSVLATVGTNIYVASNSGVPVFSITGGSGDFTINTTTPEFAIGSLGVSGYGNVLGTGNWGMWAGLPTCYQFGASSSGLPVSAGSTTQLTDTSYDCLVYVTFNPTATGVRQAQLTATTLNGSVYNFSLSGIGSGGQLSIDGGQQTTFATSGSSGLSTTAGIAVSPSGSVYIADPANNRIAVCPAGAVPCAGPTTIGTGLKNPMGVALDSTGNVYIADTGNNRVLKVSQNTGTQTVLGNNVFISGGAAPGSTVPQYQFKGPQGLAVDQWNNVYVADTGNAAIVEIPSNPALGGAVKLFSYPGAPTFITPVAVAVDAKGFIYVADTGNPSNEVVRIPPGGGDLQAPASNAYSALFSSLPLFGGSGINTPNGVAVDGAGNVYVSDGTGNAVWVAPAAGPPNGDPYALNFSGLNAPAGLALDASGNLYVADSGNKRVLFVNRQNPLVSFGTVPQNLASPAQPICQNTQLSDGLNVGTSGGGCVLTVTNTGNQPLTLASPFTTVTGVSPSGDTAFGVSSTCVSPLPSGTSCTISPTFAPTTDGPQSENIDVNGGSNSMALVASTNATGAQPLASIVLTSSGGLSPAANTTPTITATVTQPHIAGNTPTGTVTFTYVIDQNTANAGLCGTGGTATVPLSGGVAQFTMPALGQGLQYTITGNYNGDFLNSATQAAPLQLTVPGISETVTASSVTYTYGQAVPAITGTVTPAPASGVSYSFTSGASQFSNVGVYPIQVVFTGGSFCSYGFPPAVTSGNAAATVTENAAPLSVVVPAYTTVYGAASFNYASGIKITGAVGNDLAKFSETFTPPDSSVLDVNPAPPAVNPYPVVATLTGKPVGNYTIKYTNGTDTVTAAPSGISVTASGTTVLTGSQNTITFAISVSSLVPAGKGVPTGTVTVTDNFVPITSTVFGPPCSANLTTNCNNNIPPCTGGVTTGCNTPVVLTLAAGAATFSLPNTAAAAVVGTHNFSFAYSGDAGASGDGKADFQCSVFGEAAVGTCASGGSTPVSLIVDNKDFTVTSTTGPITVLPGVVPSGLGLPALPGQSTAATETAPITVTSVLSFTGGVTMSCTTQNPTYVFCSMTPPSVTVGSTAQTSILSVYTPATLPLGFFGSSSSSAQLKTSATRTVLAFLPLGLLAFCVRRRRRLSQALWMLMVLAGVSAGMSGCGGGNQVDFYTPVPTGPQTVTVTATSSTAGVSRSLIVPINID